MCTTRWCNHVFAKEDGVAIIARTYPVFQQHEMFEGIKPTDEDMA